MTEQLILYGVINILVSTLSGAAGGGGGLVAAPLLISLGLSPASALATMKFGGLGISLGTTYRFLHEKLTDKRTIIIFTLLSAFGAVIGSLTLIALQDQTALLEKVIGGVILLIGIPLLYAKNFAPKTRKPTKFSKSIGYVLLTVGIILQAALGSGIGSVQMVILMGCFGMTALVASATRRAVQITVALLSLGIFLTTDLVDFRFGSVAFITSLVGGYLGAHMAIKKGDKFIVNLFAFTSALLALQLLFF